MDTVVTPLPASRADRIGVLASILCAIHCAATPFLLIVLPAFGEIWAHPASHWIAAAFVVPLAFIMVIRGYRVHRKKWILAAGVLGIGFILMGAALPHMGSGTAKPAYHDSSCKADLCCPSVVTNSSGQSRLHLPASAVITTLGGIALITTHLGNLCACRGCKVCKP